MLRAALLEWPSRIPRSLTLVVGLLMVAVLTVVDYVTGSEISFSVFYLAPVLYVTWWAGRGRGMIVAVISAGTWGLADVAAGATYSMVFIPIWNSAVRLGFFVVTLWLLGEMRRANRAALELAHTDALTGVANARSFYAELERGMTLQRRYGRPFTLAYIDLDRFKRLNDALGHAAGDDLLCDVANGLSSAARETDVVARLGGDEFAVILPETGEEAAAAAVARLGEAIHDALAAGGGRPSRVGASIGAVVFRESPESADAAVKLADDAMYDAKRTERGTIRLVVRGRSPLALRSVEAG